MAQVIKGLAIGPMSILISQIVEETEVTPLLKLQADPHWEAHGWLRGNTWTVLQTHGLCLETRISQIERILSETLKFSNHQIFDAVTDASIFTRCSLLMQLKYLVTSLSGPIPVKNLATSYDPQHLTVYSNIGQLQD
jgi:hypothetical protein